MSPTQPTPEEELLRRRVAELEAALKSTKKTLAKVSAERDALRRAYEQLKAHYYLLQRRIFAAKAERIDTRQLEIEFEETKAKLTALAQELDEDVPAPSDDGAPASERSKRRRSSGRRNLRDIHMPEERVEITDPALEGVAERIRFEDTCLLGYRRGGPVRIVMARAVYKVIGDDDAPKFVTADKPKERYERGILAPSFIAHVLTKKYRFGMPFHRLVEQLASEGIHVDDSTMGRYAEHVGASLGCIVDAAFKEAKSTAFCLSTDATGVAIQPEPIASGKRQACRKGHLCAAGHKCPYAEPRFMRSRVERTALSGAMRAVS